MVIIVRAHRDESSRHVGWHLGDGKRPPLHATTDVDRSRRPIRRVAGLCSKLRSSSSRHAFLAGL
jgi:hypothetical protein